MHIITLDHISVFHGAYQVFADLTWAIGDHDRIGLVGPNGAGKSTLIKTIAGIIQPDVGAVAKMRGVRVCHLPQDVHLPPGQTLLETAQTPPARFAAIDAELRAIEALLGEPEVYGDADALSATLERQERALMQWEQAGGALYLNRVKGILAHLGFTPEDYALRTETLSGGQKKLVALAMLAADAPDVLLLDEPDNHLDLDAKRKLEAFIRGYDGAVLIISHDRYLLDETVTQIAELEDGALAHYAGNYSQYVAEKQARRERQAQMYVAQQKRITQIEEAIKRFELSAHTYIDPRSARQARSRRKMLERWEANGEIIDKLRERRVMDIALEGGRGSQKALELRGVSMAFGEDPLFFDLNFILRHGERVGLIGPNGAGKSVLFKLILGQLQPIEGEVRVGPSSKIGYYAQEHQTLDKWLDRTLIDYVRDVKAMPEGNAVSTLLKFAFSYRQTRELVRSLSGGERSRLQLLTLMLQQPNLLLLDEPTNNLDIASAEALEAALEDFEGALLVISHDRYFLDRVVDRVVELDDGVLTPFEGGYTEYLAARGR